MAIFTLLYIDGSSLGDRPMLLSTSTQQTNKKNKSKNCSKPEVYTSYRSLGSPISHSMFRVIEYGDTVELIEILNMSKISKPMRDRGVGREREREKEREGGREREERKEERVALTWMVSNRHTLSPG